MSWVEPILIIEILLAIVLLFALARWTYRRAPPSERAELRQYLYLGLVVPAGFGVLLVVGYFHYALLEQALQKGRYVTWTSPPPIWADWSWP